MKLGSLKEGGRDGTLVVVSRDLTKAARAGAVAPTLQRYFTASFDDLSGAANLPGMPEETSGNGSTSDIESA